MAQNGRINSQVEGHGIGASISGAEAFLGQVADSGIHIVFANPGTTEMWLVGALDKLGGRLRPVLCLAETVATGAADGYARMAQKPSATILHLGPGLANGIANLHNARRAGSPVLNIVGDMAQWHADADPLLAMDIQGLAATVSRFVARPLSLPSAITDFQSAMQMMKRSATPEADDRLSGKIATLVLPHDVSWETVSDTGDVTLPPVPPPSASITLPSGGSGGGDVQSPAVTEFIRECAQAMRAAGRGNVAMYLGGDALLKEELTLAGKVAAATGTVLLCENGFARIDRGAGLPSPRRLPYFPQDAVAALSPFKMLVTVGTRRPVAMFGYRNGPSQLIQQSDDDVWELDAVAARQALALLASETGALQSVKPLVNCGGVFLPPSRPLLPSPGKLTAASLCQTIAALQPEGCVLVDESLTSGGSYWDASKACPPFSHLSLTGGAIGSGIPMATGAAIACPGRKVINFQADGSAMYSVQGLWTQAREKLDVVTVICANSAYAILKIEMAKQQISSSRAQSGALMDLGRPRIDWVTLARGLGVRASSAGSNEEAAEQLRAALQSDGPHLIEARLA